MMEFCEWICQQTHLMRYAEAIAAVIIALNTENVQRRLNQVTRHVKHRLDEHGLDLITAKQKLYCLPGNGFLLTLRCISQVSRNSKESREIP